VGVAALSRARAARRPLHHRPRRLPAGQGRAQRLLRRLAARRRRALVEADPAAEAAAACA
jgi:hypothetical protein